MKIVRKMIWHH